MKMKIGGPIWIRSERRLCLLRVLWNIGRPGFGGTSNKISVSLAFVPKLAVFGLRFGPEFDQFDRLVWVYLIPCFPIRLHLVRSWGGSMI